MQTYSFIFFLGMLFAYASSNTLATLQRHNTQNSRQIFPEKKLRYLSPNFRIHVSVSDLYIPTIGSAYSAAGKYVDRSAGNIYKSLTENMNVEIWD